MSDNLPESTMNVTVGQEIVANAASRKLVPGWGGRISAALVWDGTDEVRIPPSMGTPRADQMQGTARERLTEVALRICYDSMGTGRSSEKCHEHIGQVKHYSVAEHAAFTVEVDEDMSKHAVRLLNRPCLRVSGASDGGCFRVTLNLRHAIDHAWDAAQGSLLDAQILHHANRLAPQIIKRPDFLLPVGKFDDSWTRIVEPETDHEKWITLYLTGSRGMSHELVRHGDWTAISQRSTRYVDESESEWVMHPLIAAYLAEMGEPLANGFIPSDLVTDGILDTASTKAAYDRVVEILQPWLKAKGVDSVSARKQARGAARGLLGNALETEVIFSASVAQWKWMLKQRGADAADAEIRQGFVEAVLPCLRASRYGDRFADVVLRPASDGIGRSLTDGSK